MHSAGKLKRVVEDEKAQIARGYALAQRIVTLRHKGDLPLVSRLNWTAKAE